MHRDDKTLTLVVLAVALSVIWYGQVAGKNDEIAHYKVALDKITNDMAINYQLQRDTLHELADCEVVRDTLAGH